MGRLLGLSCLALLISTQALAAPIYKWVDKQGNTHFASQPPEDARATAINPAIAPATESTQATVSEPAEDAEQQAIDQEVKQKVADEQKKLKDFCKTQRQNLAQLNNNPRVKVEEEGQMRRLTEEERQEKIQAIEQSIKQECQGV